MRDLKIFYALFVYQRETGAFIPSKMQKTIMILSNNANMTLSFQSVHLKTAYGIHCDMFMTGLSQSYDRVIRKVLPWCPFCAKLLFLSLTVGLGVCWWEGWGGGGGVKNTSHSPLGWQASQEAMPSSTCNDKT